MISYEKLEYLLSISNLIPLDIGIGEPQGNPFPSDDELSEIMEGGNMLDKIIVDADFCIKLGGSEKYHFLSIEKNVVESVEKAVNKTGV